MVMVCLELYSGQTAAGRWTCDSSVWTHLFMLHQTHQQIRVLAAKLGIFAPTHEGLNPVGKYFRFSLSNMEHECS